MWERAPLVYGRPEGGSADRGPSALVFFVMRTAAIQGGLAVMGLWVTHVNRVGVQGRTLAGDGETSRGLPAI